MKTLHKNINEIGKSLSPEMDQINAPLHIETDILNV